MTTMAFFSTVGFCSRLCRAMTPVQMKKLTEHRGERSRVLSTSRLTSGHTCIYFGTFAQASKFLVRRL